MIDVFKKAFETVKPAVALLWAGVQWIIFPTQSFIVMFTCVWIAAILDLFTRWRVIFKKNGGILNSIQTRAWNSETMFERTKTKIIAYLVVQILAGSSMRFVDIPYVSNAVATVVYSFLFFREASSNVENLIESGADYLQPLLFWMKKKEKKALEEVITEETQNGDDHIEQI